MSKFLIYDSLTSTNELAISLLSQNPQHGDSILAYSQTEGRGQYGRVWQSDLGGLYLSIILKDIDLDDITLKIGKIIEEYLEDYITPPTKTCNIFPAKICVMLRCRACLTPVKLRPSALPNVNFLENLFASFSRRSNTNQKFDIKLPNDILYKGEKICGILVESKTCGKNVWAVIGIGLNVNNQNYINLKSIIGVEQDVLKIASEIKGRIMEELPYGKNSKF